MSTMSTIVNPEIDSLSQYPHDPSTFSDEALDALQRETRRAHFWLSAERVRRQYAEEFPDVSAIQFTNYGDTGDGFDSWGLADIDHPEETLMDESTPVFHLSTLAEGLYQEGDQGAFVLDLRTLRFLDPDTHETFVAPAPSSPGSGLWQSTYQVEVLRDSPPPHTEDLAEINEEITDGPSSGFVSLVSVREVSHEEMAALLVAQGSDPGFLDADEG